jgi:hypothetical protein
VSDREDATATTKGNSRSLRDDNKKNKGNCNGEATATGGGGYDEGQQQIPYGIDNKKNKRNCNGEATATGDAVEAG